MDSYRRCARDTREQRQALTRTSPPAGRAFEKRDGGNNWA